MKKYLYIFKSEFMTSLQYIPNTIFGFIGVVIMLFIFLNLWGYIYSDPSELINGYNMSQMIWYVIITEIIWSTSSMRTYCNKIVDDVKGGNITYNINKPYSYIGYCLSSHFGRQFIKSIIYIIIAIPLGYLFLGVFPKLSFLSILATIITGILAVLINTLAITIIGLFSFFIEDAKPFYWVYSKLILVLGTTFPLEFFPSVIQPIIKFSPIYVVSYGPAKLFVDFSLSSFASIIIFQIFYVLIGYLLCKLIYKKGVRNLNVNGG